MGRKKSFVPPTPMTTAPTPPMGDNSNLLATTAFVAAVTNLKAPLNSPTFTGTVAGIDKTMVGLSLVDNTSDVNKPISNATQIALNLKANLNSPVFVNPALGTPASGIMTNVTGTAVGLTAGNVLTNANLTGHITSVGNATVLGSFTSAQLATALSDETGSGSNVFAVSPTLVTPNIGVATGTSFNGITALASVTPVMDGTATIGTSTAVARQDHIHPTDTSRAPIASPTFTGIPTAPTAAVGDNSNQLATTAFVTAATAATPADISALII